MSLQRKILAIPSLSNDDLLDMELEMRKQWRSALAAAGFHFAVGAALVVPELVVTCGTTGGGVTLLLTTIAIGCDLHTWKEALEYLDELRLAMHTRRLEKHRLGFRGRVGAVTKGVMHGQ